MTLTAGLSILYFHRARRLDQGPRWIIEKPSISKGVERYGWRELWGRVLQLKGFAPWANLGRGAFLELKFSHA